MPPLGAGPVVTSIECTRQNLTRNNKLYGCCFMNTVNSVIGFHILFLIYYIVGNCLISGADTVLMSESLNHLLNHFVQKH